MILEPNSKSDKIECEWHTKDPTTGEIIFLQNGVLYSKLPSSSNSTKIISLNHSMQSKDKCDAPPDSSKQKDNESLTQIAKFSSIDSGKNIQIFGGGAVAALNSDNGEDFAVVTSIIPNGVAYIEFICPISCTNLSFGMCSLEQIKTKNVNRKQFKNFKNSSRRKVIMEINYKKKSVEFYLDGAFKDKTYKFKDSEVYPCVCIEKKNTAIILNPNVHYNFERDRNVLMNHLVFIKVEEEVALQNSKDKFNAYIEGCFEEKVNANFDCDYDEKGNLNGFICIIFDDKKKANSFRNRFTQIRKNSNIYMIPSPDLSKISKCLFQTLDLSNIHKSLVITKTNLVAKEFSGDDNKLINKIMKYLVNKFESIPFAKGSSIEVIKGMIKMYSDISEKDFISKMKAPRENKPKDKFKIEYLPLTDSMLVIKSNEIKVIKRDINGQFDYSALEDLSSSVSAHLKLLISVSDLQFLINKFDWMKFLYQDPSVAKFIAVKNFFNAIQYGNVISDNKVLLSINKGYILFSQMKNYLSTMAIITKEQKQLEQRESIKIQNESSLSKSTKTNDKKPTLPLNQNNKDAKMNVELDKELPFAIESEEKDISDDEPASYQQYSDLMITNVYEFSILDSIINKIISQISIRNSKNKVLCENNLYSSFDNLSTFINYPFRTNQDITQLADKGFYVENSFTNEIKLFNYQEKLINTDELINDETIEEYFKRNFPTNMVNSALVEYYPVVNCNYTINNMNYYIDSLMDIELHSENISKPLMVTYSKNGIANIYNYHLGITKLGSVNVLKMLHKISSFEDVNGIFWIENKKDIKNVNSILNYKVSSKSPTSSVFSKTVTSSQPKEVPISQEHLSNLYSMGFSMKACKEALKLNGNDFNKALEYLLENPNISGDDEEETAKVSTPQETSNVVIKNWQCSVCTYMNEKGTKTCEMCDSPIPKAILDKFEKSSKTVSKPEHKESPKPTTGPKEENKFEPDFKDVIVKGIHICFNPTKDPLAPFLLVVVMFNFVENKMIISVYKLMINLLAAKDFITYEKDKLVTDNIILNKYSSLEVAMKNLNSNYFHNLHTLFPLYVSEGEENHLIPIEHKSLSVDVTSIYDSFTYDIDIVTGNVKLDVLCEMKDGNVQLCQYDIKSEYKFNDISKETLSIVPIEQFAKIDIRKQFDDSSFLTELKVLSDSKNEYVVGKGGIVVINDKEVTKKGFNSTVGLLRNVIPKYNSEYKSIESIDIYDDNGKIINVDIIDSNEKQLPSNDKKEENKTFTVSKLEIGKITEEEISSLSQMLDVERIKINLSKSDSTLKGLIKSSQSLPGEFNKIYYNTSLNLPKHIELSNKNFVILSEIDLVFNMKNISREIPKTENQKILLNDTTSTPLSQDEFSQLNDFIPLTIVDFKGAQCQSIINVSSILYNAHRFVSNYPRPEYIFSHLHNKQMIIDNIIISSDESPKSNDIPFGEGLIFLLNSLENIPLCKEKYKNCTQEAFSKLNIDKRTNNEDFYEYDPVCYINMGTSQIVKTSVVKSRRCKYIYFLPTNGRNGNLNDFNSFFMSLLFFGVEGKVEDADDYSNETPTNRNYIHNAIGDYKNINDVSIELFGITDDDKKISIGSKKGCEIESTINNSEICGQFFISKNVIANRDNQEIVFKAIDVSVSGNSNVFDLIGVSCDFISFKQIEGQKGKDNNEMSLISNFHKLLLNSGEFEKFNLLFATNLSNLKIGVAKRIEIIKYIIELFNKLPSVNDKIYSVIDYVSFIKNNIITTDSECLSTLSNEFLKNALNRNMKSTIEKAFTSILSQLSSIPFTYVGLNFFVSLIHLIHLESSEIENKLIELVKTCLKTIKAKNFQKNEQIYLTNYMKINEYPFDFYCFDISQKKEQKSSGAVTDSNSLLSYETLSSINGDMMEMIIDLKEVQSISKLKLLFSTLSDNAPDYNFNVSIFSDENGKTDNNFLSIKNFKYYYDHVWKQLRKYSKGKDAKNKDASKIITFQTEDHRSLEFSFPSFTSRYLIVNISIKDGTKEYKTFPNEAIYPLVFGQRTMSSEGNYKYEKIDKMFTIITTKTKEVELLGNSFTIKTGNDSKKMIICYSNGDKPKIENVADMSKLKSQYLVNMENYQNVIIANINNVISGKNFDYEKFKKQNENVIENIKTLQKDISKLNSPVKLEESLSLNMMLIKVLINELNKSSTNLSNLDTNFIFELMTVTLFNESDANASLQSSIYDFIHKFFFTNDNQNVNVLFDMIIKTYLDKENIYISSMNIVNILTSTNFSIDLIVKELKKVFEDDSQWTCENFKNIFYKISILLLAIKNKVKISSIEISPIIDMTIAFIKKLTANDKKITNEMSHLLLSQVLNLLLISISSKSLSISKQRESLFSFVISLAFELWDNDIIRKKIETIIDVLIDPYDVLENEANGKKAPKEYSTTNNATILIVQAKTLEFIKAISETKEKDADKFDYILNLLNKCYAISNSIEKSEDADNSEAVIKTNNSEIIEGFIAVAAKFNYNTKIGFSNANNFWKYLTDILERGSLDMMFYKDNFKKLILNSFLGLQSDLQDILHTKFTNAFYILYFNEGFAIKPDALKQIIDVISFIVDNYTGKESEKYLMNFMVNLTEILLYGNAELSSNVSNKTIKLNTSRLAIKENKSQFDSMMELFTKLSDFLLRHLNLSSFTGSICNDELIYLRMHLARNMLTIMTIFIDDFFSAMNDETAKSEVIKKSLRNYLIYLIFNRSKKQIKSPILLTIASSTWEHVNTVIDACISRKSLIEDCLIEIMKIVRKVDDSVFIGIKNSKIPMKNGINIINKLFTTLRSVLNKFLIDDDITKYFAFELQGFKFFIDRVISHRQLTMFNKSEDISSEDKKDINIELNNELLKTINLSHIEQSDELQLKDNKSESSNFTGNLSTFKKEEFAISGKLNLLELTAKSAPVHVSNVNWSSKKKPSTGHVYSKEFKGKNYYEECLIYELPYIVELKEILISFNNIYTTSTDRITDIIPTVILECGCSLDKMDICVKMNKLNDQQYTEKSVTAFGFNFYSNKPDSLSTDDDYLENFIDQLINCRAKYFKFIVRRPIILSNKNTLNPKLSSSLFVMPVNCVSLYGTKLADTQKVLEYIQEKEKNVSIKIISKIFTAEFIDTLRYIAQDQATIDNIKQIYNAFEPYISKHATILSNILINVSKYNYELGEWLLKRLLNVDNSEIHAKLAVEITQNSPEYVVDRLNKFLKFIFDSLSLNNNNSIFYTLDYEKKIKNIGKFIKFFSLMLNGLAVSPFKNNITLNVDSPALIVLIKNIQKFSCIRKELLGFITILLLPHKNINIKIASALQPKEVLSMLGNLFNTEYLYDYIEIISLLVANDKKYEEIFIESDSVKFYCELFINEIGNKLRGKNMLYLMEMLKNMSFNKEFAKKVRENEYDFKIFDAVKSKNENSISILINNNINFLKNIVVFIRNCISDDKDCFEKLAKILIEDLEICKKKIDKGYANNVLMPLLRLEKTTNVCIHPIDSNLKTIFSSYCNLNAKEENENQDKKDDDTNSKATSFVDTKEKSKFVLLPKSKCSEAAQNTFKSLTSSIIPMKGEFKQIFSSSSLSDKSKSLKELSVLDKVNNFLIVVHPKTETYPTTFFFIDSKLPSFPNDIHNNDYVYNKIDYSPSNIIAQINKDKFYSANITQQTLGGISQKNSSVTLSICDSIIINPLSISLSKINPISSINVKVLKKNQMNEMVYTDVKDFEVYTFSAAAAEGTTIKSANMITPIKYIDETGNLNMTLVNSIKYYKNNHPLSTTRNNPIFEFPSTVTMKNIKELIASSSLTLKSLYNGEEISSDVTVDKVAKDDNGTIVDIYYEVNSLRHLKKDDDSKLESFIVNYEPELPVLRAFERNGGIQKIVSVLKLSISNWKNKTEIPFWLKWIDDVEKFNELPSFFSSLIRHQKCFDIIFNLLCGLYDNATSVKEVGVEASKYIYEILDNSFIESKSESLRLTAIENGIFKSILDKLEGLTHEKPRKFAPGEEKEETPNKDEKKDKTPEPVAKNKSKKGVGYGSDQTGDNKTWDVTSYLEGKKFNSMQIALIIKLLTDFFDSPELKMNDKMLKLFLESPILPCLEGAYRGGTLLELAKDEDLYYAYLNMTIKLSQNRSLIPLLLDISKDYKPIQTQSVYTLLSNLNEGARIFKACLKKDSNEKKTVEEKLSIEITRTFDEITKNIKAYQTHLDSGKNYTEILKLPVEKSYPQLMKELSFDYMSMRNSSGTLVHHYASQNSGEATSTKMIRLAQEYADLSRSLPCESTNSIYVRVDKDNMDYMKVLIMGSEGTPYSNGAFEYDVYFDSQYPQGPPKVNLMTTGGGTTRFNPNLYSNGKVCLSLLGTWRGQSTENWNPKISTLLQVLISIQSIIMSDLVYFNEPSCESEMGKPEGEAKNEAYSNIVRYCNIKFAMIEQIKKPSKGFEEVIKRHFYLKKEQILKEVRGWIERSKKTNAKYSSYSYDHNTTWANKFNQPGNYTKMLEEIYIELEKTLNDLPLPSDLEKKANDEKIQKEKKAEKMTFVDIDKIDVSYDNNVNKKEININDDDVKDRWSRYIGAMGIEAVQRQANSSIFLSGANGVGIEIAKNIVLSGCKKFVLHDTKLATYYDLSSQFFLGENDIGVNRAEASLKKLQQLNYYVKTMSSTKELPLKESELDTFGLKDFNTVILCDNDYDTIKAVDAYCRKRNINVIVVNIMGGFARMVNDFGENFIVNDKDGEDAKECMVKEITSEANSVVTVLDGTRHDFVDGDEVVVTEVVGMENVDNDKENINGKKFKVKVISPASFSIGDTSKYKKYIRNGIVKQIKTSSIIKFAPIEKCISVDKDNHMNLFNIDENMSMSDYSKINHASVINLGMAAIDKYKSTKKENVPWSYDTATSVIAIAQSMVKAPLTDEEIEILYLMSFTYMVQFAPLCAYIGGFAAQEAIKAITNKFTPVNQVMFHDVIEVMPTINIKNINESIKEFNFKEQKNRNVGLNVLLGEKITKKIEDMKLLMVGAGAIGCELLKNFAMLNIGTGENGAMYITDPDIIEVSNLTRQFLFREKHLRLPKSSTAAAAAVQMNPKLKNHIFAKLDKVCEETEQIFTDDFFNSLSVVANALDNVNARRYVDSRCVSSRIPLLESGTLGPKGHVQVIIPFKTESYASQNDPEVSNDIPQCTLKMFPEEAIHCVEWARDQFGKIFTQLPKTISKVIEEEGNGSELKLLKKSIKWMKKAPKNFEDCLLLAREKFNKVFVNNIKQLMYSYPIDKKDKNGKLFWSLPKRPPVIDEFDINDELCVDFIAAYACLMANMFGVKIPYEHPRDKAAKKEMCAKVKDAKVEAFTPSELKAKQIESEVEKDDKKEEEKSLEKEINTSKTEDNVELLIIELKDLLVKHKEMKLTSTEFEKDNDANYHIDIIYSMSALRCRNYKLEPMDWMKVKIKAGRIIPALATTTASIAGLQAMELVKIAKNSDIANYRNSFLNLAIPFFQSAEPGPCKKVILHEGLSTNLWDRWEISLEKDKENIKSLFEILKTKYLLCPRDIFKKKKAIYSYMGYKDKKEMNEEIMNKKLDVLLGIDKESEEYVDLIITFTKDEKTEEYLKDIPKVRVYFAKEK